MFLKVNTFYCFQWRRVSIGRYQNRNNEYKAWFLKLHACVICVYSYHDRIFSYSNYTGDQPPKKSNFLICMHNYYSACATKTVAGAFDQYHYDYKLLK